jgi:nuclear GTP-binding protein
VLVDWNHHKIPFFSEPPALHSAHVPSTMPGAAQVVAPGAETTGNAQIVSALGAPFILEGLFGEADAEAMDAEPSSRDVEGMQIDEDEDDHHILSRKRAHSPALSDDPAFRAPKRLRRVAVRSASLPAAAIAVRSRRVERQARRKREKAAAALKATAVSAGMEVDSR